MQEKMSIKMQVRKCSKNVPYWKTNMEANMSTITYICRVHDHIYYIHSDFQKHGTQSFYQIPGQDIEFCLITYGANY